MAKKEYGPVAFQLLEDRLARISGTIREIRQSLVAGPLNMVTLKANTFVHYVTELEQLSQKYLGELRAQKKRRKPMPANKISSVR